RRWSAAAARGARRAKAQTIHRACHGVSAAGRMGIVRMLHQLLTGRQRVINSRQKWRRYTMVRNLLTILLLLSGLLNGASAVLAHHSEAAEYDSSKPVKVTGVLSKVEWQNPHIWFYVDVKDENGKITTWGFSSGPPGSL